MSKAARQGKNGRGVTHREDPILSCSEVGRQLGKHRQTVARWCMDGLLKAWKMPGGKWGVRQSEVNQFLQGSALPIKEVKEPVSQA